MDASALLRLVAIYVACLLAWQGLAAAIALGQGPLHRHRTAVASVVAPLLQHGRADVHAHADAHAHADNRRHLHASHDASVVHMAASAGEEAPDLLAFALTSAMALLALGSRAVRQATHSAVMCPHRPWALKPAPAALPFRPPRAA